MPVSCFGDSKSVLIITAGILTRYKTEVGSKVLGRSKALEIADFNQNRKRSMCLHTDEATKLFHSFLVFILCGKLLNTLIQSLKLV